MMVSRRTFFKWSLGTLSALVLSRCFPENKKQIRVSFKDNFSGRGHETWKNKIHYTASEKTEHDVVIIGSGISGLSAAYHLQKNGIHNIAILELADKPGGNSQSGKNEYSEYPYGAHYLTLPNPDNEPLISFLKDKQIITGIDANKQLIYNETDLCFDPEERLLLRGTFQDGLVPTYGLNEAEKKELARFFKLMEQFRRQKGADGKFFFNIPCSMASQDAELDHLDATSFKDFLIKEGFKSDYVYWYLNYCCRDDFGGGIQQVSAWAGINYFAAHRAEASNTDGARVLTWPEGNGRLVELLTEKTKDALYTGRLVKNISLINNKAVITGIDFNTNTSFEIHCKSCIVAIPPFVTARILNKTLPYPFEKVKHLQHAPWLVAAITLTAIPEGRGAGLCWDNVAYGSKSLGYINNRHQELKHPSGKTVISLYLPLDDTDGSASRKTIENRNVDDWKKIVLQELELMHNGISNNVESIELCIWGHGMILPSVGLSKGKDLKELAAPIQNTVFFAHTDLSAYSIFEEAFDQGYRAADQVKNKIA
jgi:protoporphyrinogen oxidase